MKRPELIRTVRELESHMRRMYRLIELLGIELDHTTDELSRVRMCLDQIETATPLATPLTAPQLVPPTRPATCSEPSAARRAGFTSHTADPAPRVIIKMQFVDKVDGSAVLVLLGEKPGDTRRVRLPAASAELFRSLAADDGRPRVGDCVSAKPNSELLRKLHTRNGKPLSYGALRQRVSVLRRYLVERGFLHPEVLSDVTVGGEPGYSLAYRNR